MTIPAASVGAPKRRYLNAFLENESTVALLYRDPGGAMRVERAAAEYVTYLAARDVDDKLERTLRSSNYVRGVKREGEWLRVGWRDSTSRSNVCFDQRSPFVQSGIPTYEGDVDPIRRLLTDRGAEIESPRPVYLDLETDSRVPFSRKEEMRILSWAIVDPDGNKALGVLEEDTDASEKELLDALWEALVPYDQVVAWNGNGFDFPVLFARSRERGCEADARRWLWLDHLALFKRMNMHSAESGEEKQSMRLEDIAQAVVGEGKEKTPTEIAARFGDKPLGALSWQLWEAGGEFRELLARYNLRDTDLLRRIEEKNGYLALFQTLCEACRLFGETRGLNPTHQMDGFMLRLGLERGHHFPTKKYRESLDQFEGAYVMKPRSHGIERNVHVADFAALYPSIILTWNMSPDTKAPVPVNGPIPPGTCRSPSTGVGFRVDTHGILPTALREMLRLRKFWNDKKASLPPGTPEWHEADRRSTAYKVAANSFYGVVGSPFSRYFDRAIAESITQNGAWLIKLTIHAAEQRKWKVIYADTDSLFVVGCTKDEFAEFVAWCNTDLYPKAIADCGCTENVIKLAYEKAFDRLILVTAKRYIGSYSHYKGKPATADSKPEIKGLEFKRGDTLRMARELQGQVIESLVRGGEAPEDYHEALSRSRTHVLDATLLLDDVKLAKALSKPLREYVVKRKKDGSDASQPPHVVVAHILAERGQDVGEGTRIEYIVTDGAASPMKVIPADDYTGTEVDRYYIWESLVYPPTERLLAAAFPDHDWATWGKVRPPKLRGRARVLPGQLPLPESENRFSVHNHITPAPARRRRVDGPVSIVVTGDAAKGRLEALRGILREHPGQRPVSLTLKCVHGADAVLAVDPDLRVNGSLELIAAIEEWKRGISVS